MARRGEREYWEYATEEQRSQRGCPARELTETSRVPGTNNASVSLVAHRLLSDPCNRGLYDRARDDLARLVVLRPLRPLRPQVRTRLVVADPEDDRRHRRAARPRPPAARHQLRVRRQPPEHLRHSGAVLDTGLRAADPGQGLAGRLSVSRLASGTHRPRPRRSQEPRRRPVPPGAGADAGGLLALRVPGGHPEPRRLARARSAPAPS